MNLFLPILSNLFFFLFLAFRAFEHSVSTEYINVVCSKCLIGFIHKVSHTNFLVFNPSQSLSQWSHL